MTWQLLLAQWVGTVLVEGILILIAAAVCMPTHARVTVCGWSRAGLGIRCQGVRNWTLVLGPFQLRWNLPERHISCPESWVVNGHRACVLECPWCHGSAWLNGVDRHRLLTATPEQRREATRKVAPWLMDASEEPLTDLDGPGQT